MIKKLPTIIIGDTKLVLQSLKNDGLIKTIRYLNSRDAPGLVQFAKYGICGVISVIVLIIATEIASKGLSLPFDEPEEGFLTQEAKDLSEKNLMICSAIAFPFANFAAYFTNVLWVFTPGKHHWFKEFSLFTGVALFAFVVGLIGGPILVSKGLNPRIAQAGLIVTSALVNYACRKVLIFMK